MTSVAPAVRYKLHHSDVNSVEMVKGYNEIREPVGNHYDAISMAVAIPLICAIAVGVFFKWLNKGA